LQSLNAPFAFEHKKFVSGAIKEMVEAGSLTRLSRGQRPTVVSPIGVVPKPHSDKFRLMRYVNKHLAKTVFKIEGLADLADIAEKSDHSVSYDLKSG